MKTSVGGFAQRQRRLARNRSQQPEGSAPTISMAQLFTCLPTNLNLASRIPVQIGTTAYTRTTDSGENAHIPSNTGACIKRRTQVSNFLFPIDPHREHFHPPHHVPRSQNESSRSSSIQLSRIWRDFPSTRKCLDHSGGMIESISGTARCGIWSAEGRTAFTQGRGYRRATKMDGKDRHV